MFSVYLKRDFRSAFCALELTVDSITLTNHKLENEKKRGGRSERGSERKSILISKSNIKPIFRDL